MLLRDILDQTLNLFLKNQVLILSCGYEFSIDATLSV